ncbi:MAG: NAD(P)-dependent alcohol dehydrogenase [Chloroflexi bacterium]|nr:MAG: NAD(P)-dependent alcohol dehydrogenase [Chloroflexota bacterium]MBL1192741.1 NAD(P)-dependent alcohol dehydrogenase [Chloroflexota bacterium]NOH10034.1 NAD(P)-dependent alcohol dehydrogenase [Chloroflexota bacterium]
MKAIVQNRYGSFDALEYGTAEKPTPGDDEALVKVHAAAINFGNLMLISGKPIFVRTEAGWLRPNKTLNPGSDVAGRVEAVGVNMTQFKPGDEVMADNLAGGSGTYAEYVCVPENELALKPANVTFAEAAAAPQAALVALQALRDVGNIQAGQKVLIIGASGGNGSYAVQVAKAFGAVVTAVCSTRNIELVRRLGADHVIDYTQEDFAANGEQYDLILCMGGYRKLKDYVKALLPKGTFVWAGGNLKGLFETFLWGSWATRGTEKRVTNLSHHSNQDDLRFMAELMKDGKVKSEIDRIFSLEETAEAFRHYAGGHMQGKVVISVIEDSAG